MLHNLKAATSLVVILFIGITLFAQPKENDPYTILGFGNINELSFAGLRAMPGLSATYNDPFQINLQNPASSSYLSQAAFEAGGYYQFKKLATPDATDKIHTGNLSYLALGLPLFNTLNESVARKKKPFKLGMTISLTPYSAIGYDLEKSRTFDGVGEVVSTFEGNGATNKFLWGNSFKYKNFSVGINIGYLFGKQSKEQWDYFLGFEDEYRNFYLDETSIKGFVWNVGGLYEYVLPQKVELDAQGNKILKQRTRITVGVHGNSKNEITTTSERIQLRRQSVGNVLVDVDTIAYQSEYEGKATLPGEFGVGLMVSRDAHWKIGFDYTLSTWSKYSNDVDPASLADSYKIGFGAEYIPQHNAPFKHYRKRIMYRIGGFYKTDPRSATGDSSSQFSHKALTFGVGLPLQPDRENRKLISFVNISGEFGQYGDPDFLKETYFKLNLGFTLNDNLWFFKRKYN